VRIKKWDTILFHSKKSLLLAGGHEQFDTSLASRYRLSLLFEC